MKTVLCWAIAVLVAALGTLGAYGEEEQPLDVDILLLSASQDFAHGPIVQKDGQPSVADVALAKVAEQLGARFTSTKDAARINADDLKDIELVIFYTQGDLTKPNKEGGAPMAEDGVAALTAWIRNGGGFMGYHSATDTFDTNDPEPTPYIQMIGAEFRSHGAQFTGTLRVVDAAHPTMAHFADAWQIHDEWYLFRKFNKETMHVLALMDPGDEGAKQDAYNIPPYPVVWCSGLGKGRIYFNAMGHREDVWENAAFQKTIADAIRWSVGKGPVDAEPNFDKVVPGEKEGESAPAEK